jgi:hypothetical protein
MLKQDGIQLIICGKNIFKMKKIYQLHKDIKINFKLLEFFRIIIRIFKNI